jgi:hypothetical protein
MNLYLSFYTFLTQQYVQDESSSQWFLEHDPKYLILYYHGLPKFPLGKSLAFSYIIFSDLQTKYVWYMRLSMAQ